MTTTPELKPCPFCGSDDAYVTGINLYASFIRCNKCGSQGAPYTTDLKAIRAWNTRAQEEK